MATSRPPEVRVTANPARVLAYAVFWFIVVTLGFSIAGLTLAVLGLFTPIALAIVGTATATVFGAMSWSPFRRGIQELLYGGALPIVVVTLVVIASGVSAGVFSAEHVLTNRDPGVYVTTAKWLANEGTLLVDGAVGGFEGIDGVTGYSLGYYEERSDGLLNPQFMHLLPVWGAAAQWIGGDQALFRVNVLAIMGAISAFWLFAALIFRPWLAVLATVGVAVNLVTVHFARDVYSEPLAMMLIFASLAVLVIAEYSQSIGLSLVTGILIGATAAARVDAWLVIIAFAVYLEVRWFIAERRGDRSVIGRCVQPILLGMLMGGSIALFDGLFRSAPYIVGRRVQFLAMMGLLVVVLVGGAIARLPRLLAAIRPGFERTRRIAAWLIPVVIGVAMMLLYFVRPAVQEGHGSGPNPVVAFAQRAEALPLDATRSYSEWSLHWLSWYLGVAGLAVGGAGLALAWRRSLTGRRILVPFVMVASLTTAVFILLPSITPDQLWAMRRFLPVTIPALILASTLIVEWAVDRWHMDARRWLVVGAAVALLILVPASFTWPLRNATAHRGMYGFTVEVCETLPDNSALLVVSQTHALVVQAAVRSFCAVPVAGIYEWTEDPAAAIEAARVGWADRGVTLYIGGVLSGRTGAEAIETTYQIPEIVLTRRPSRLIDLSFGIEIAPAVPLRDSADA